MNHHLPVKLALGLASLFVFPGCQPSIAPATGVNPATSGSPETVPRTLAGTNGEKELPPAEIARGITRVGRTWAVVIGVGQYDQVTDLRFAARDADAVAAALAESGDVQPEQLLKMSDTSPEELRPTAARLEERIAHWLAQPNDRDTMLVYFAGHGTLGADGALYLAPRDIELVDPAEEPSGVRRGLSLAWLRQTFADCKAKTKVLLLDACHSGSARNLVRRQLLTDGEQLAKVFQGLEGLMTISSSQGNQKSIEAATLEHGLFTYWLVRGLRGEADADQDRRIQCDELYQFLYANVEESARERKVVQTPVRTMVGLPGVPVLLTLHSSESGSTPAPLTPAPPLVELPPAVAALPAAEVLRIAYLQPPPVNKGAAKPANLKLDVQIRAKRAGEEKFRAIVDGEKLASETDDYKIVIRPHAAGYLYVFQLDSNGQICWLFPQNDTTPFSSGRNPVRPDADLLIPNLETGEVLFLDRLTGIEQVYAVATAAPWPALEAALARAKPAAAAATRGASQAGVVQAPNRLGRRGVGGVRPKHSTGAHPKTPASDTSDLALVLERWFRHVD